MSELIDKMNQQFTDMQKLATEYAAMAEQALIERDKARERVARLEGALREMLNQSVTNRAYCYEKNPDWRRSNERVNMTSASELQATNALEGK